MRFLVQFRGIHNDFRLSEFLCVIAQHRNCPESSLTDLNLQPAHDVLTNRVRQLPRPDAAKCGDAGVVLYGEIFYYVDLVDQAEAVAIATRCVLVRAMYVPAAHALNYHQCVQSLNDATFSSALDPLRDAQKKPSFRCVVDAFGKSLSVEEQLERIHVFSELLRTFPGKVKLKNPQYDICILEDAFPKQGHGFKSTHVQPRQVFLARKIAEGQGSIGTTFSLKRRRYIGPTSMDAELSFIMANMAHVSPNKLVMDPFCGTGGIMVACSVLGAHVIGGDINILTLRGKGHEQNVNANFRQYGLQQPVGLLRCDVLNHPYRTRKGGWLDAIVCDPPYGIKEGMRVFREDTIAENMAQNHFQGTERVRFVDFLHGVLQFAADLLVKGGRLVYWLPTTPEYTEDDVPTHPALQLVHNCEQPLTSRMSRRLITMVRVSDTKREENERLLYEAKLAARRNGGQRSDHIPAHFDLATKLLRQPERAETRIRARDPVAL